MSHRTASISSIFGKVAQERELAESQSKNSLLLLPAYTAIEIERFDNAKICWDYLACVLVRVPRRDLRVFSKIETFSDVTGARYFGLIKLREFLTGSVIDHPGLVSLLRLARLLNDF
jgi:hypothetical protein